MKYCSVRLEHDRPTDLIYILLLQQIILIILVSFEDQLIVLFF
ncbi:unnamed protein product [Brassica napus]|uniref:(rape) hypothetical protein n=1 Tax=Brassica napus TaxID=3708 RepID=A0A816ZQF6_BRANA|nr:unnamed protein product [Brassica napus]